MKMERRERKPIQLFTDVELVEFLAWNIGLSFSVIKNLFIEQIDGRSFLLLKKKDVASLGMLDKYSQLCLMFPTAEFVNDFI